MWYALCEVPTTSPSGTPAVFMQVCRCSLSPRGDENLNILTITFCIPVITIGPALSALNYTAFRLSTDAENSVLRDFLHGFRINFRQGFILGLFSLLGIAIIGLDAFLMVSGLIDPAEAAVKTFHIFAIVLLGGFSVSAYLQAKLYKKVFERLEAVSRTVPETIKA